MWAARSERPTTNTNSWFKSTKIHNATSYCTRQEIWKYYLFFQSLMMHSDELLNTTIEAVENPTKLRLRYKSESTCSSCAKRYILNMLVRLAVSTFYHPWVYPVCNNNAEGFQWLVFVALIVRKLA